MSKVDLPCRAVKAAIIKFISGLVILLPMFLVVVACVSEKAETKVVRETVIVKIPATVEVTRFLTIEVEVTRVVEIPVTVTNESSLELTRTLTPPGNADANSTPTPYYFEPYPYGVLMGLPEIDEITREVLRRNTTALRERIIFHNSNCIHENQPWGAPCNDNEEIGAQIEVFRYAYCEGFETRDEEVIMAVLGDFVAWTTGVYAVYSGDLNDEYFHTGNLDESYGIIFTSTDNSNANIAFVENAGISGILLGCGRSPAEILEMHSDNIILPPIVN